jgi:hypothetical protein
LPDVRGYRATEGKLEEIELRALAQTLRRETPVVVCRVDDAPQARQVLLSVIKDGTIILILPRQ